MVLLSVYYIYFNSFTKAKGSPNFGVFSPPKKKKTTTYFTILLGSNILVFKSVQLLGPTLSVPQVHVVDIELQEQ